MKKPNDDLHCYMVVSVQHLGMVAGKKAGQLLGDNYGWVTKHDHVLLFQTVEEACAWAARRIGPEKGVKWDVMQVPHTVVAAPWPF